MKIIVGALLLMACASALGVAADAVGPPVVPIPQGVDAAAVRTTGKQEVEKIACSHRIVVGKAPSGALEAICLGTDDLAYLYAQDASGAWRAAGALPNPGKSPLRALATIPDRDQMLQVIVLGRDDGQPGIMTRTPQGLWGAVEPLPAGVSAPYSAVMPCLAPDGTQQVIGLGRKDGHPYLITHDAGKGRWFFIGALGTPKGMPFSGITVGADGVGHVPVVLVGRDDGQVYLLTQAKDGTWGAFQSLPNFNHTPFSTVTLVLGSDGYRQLLCVGRDDGQPYLIWQDAVTGTWNFYGTMANPQHTWLSSVVTGVGREGMLQAICLGRDDGKPYHLWHSPNGKWSPVAPITTPSGAPFFSALATWGRKDSGAQVVCLGRGDGQPYLFIAGQTVGAWTTAGKLTLATAPVPPPTGDQPLAPPPGNKGKRDDF